ncbi:DNA repair protein complementing XP-C cells homolog [Armigeres subalbatus]|uniref:DNA repair protein complementing XP-C cells homolog n=1 Tax=Armigeres subalbatus TaxID=124917 RepID=UPI002ED42E94
MNRARRSTAVYKKPTRKQVSDDDFESDGFEDEPDDTADFSASEDEWLPGKDKNSRSDTEAHATVSDDEVSEDVSEIENDLEEDSGSEGSVVAAKGNRAKRSSTAPTKPLPKKKRLSPASRVELYKRTKKYLLKEADPSSSPINSSVSDILKQCQFQKKRDFSHNSTQSSSTAEREKIKKPNDGDASDSSGDDHLMNPEELDLSSKFFDKIETMKQQTVETVPQFDCNAGMRLSDSSDDDQAEENIPASIQKVAAQQLISKINESSGEFMNFNNLGEFNKKMEEAKKLLKDYQSKESQECTQKAGEAGEDVSNLLALGETEAGISPGKRIDAGQQNEEASEESDWEEVEEAKKSQTSEKLANDYEITVEVESTKSKKKRWEEIEMELYIKRQINKVKRANQLAFHKSSVLCAIAAGKKMNEIVNSQELRGMALSLMQSNQCTLKGKLDGKSVEQLMKWFKNEFKLINEQILGPKTACFRFTLALELFTKNVICKRDYILLFLICLRLAGVECRLMISANVPPKRPAMKDLCPISERQLIKDFEKQFKHKSNKVSPAGESAETDAKTDEKVVDVKEDTKGSIDIVTQIKQTVTVEPSKTVVKMETMQEHAKSAIANKTLNEDSNPEIQKEDPVVQPRRTRSRTTSAQKSDRNTTSETSKQLRFSLGTDDLSGDPAKPPKNNNRPIRSALKSSSSPKVALKRITLDNLTIPQMDGIDDLKATPKNIPIARRLRNRTKTTPDSNTASPFTKRKTNTPQVKEKNNNQPGRISKRKLFVAAKQVEETAIIKPNPVKSKSSKNKILSSDSSDEEQSKPSLPTNRQPRSATNGKTKRPPAATIHSSEDSDFEAPGKRKAKRTKKVKSESPEAGSKKAAASKAKKQTTKVKKELEQVTSATDSKMNMWMEFYSIKDKRWITVDLFTGKINCVDYLVRHATSPISYVFGFDNDGHIKDLTPRYVQHWNNVSRTLRVDSKWLDKALKPFQAKLSAREKHENEELNKIDIDKPLPTTIAECKNHPLYVLKRHLLKFEALYPPDLPSLGFVRGEAIYARECLFILQTREKWYKQGRVVKPFETAYKVVKCWRYDKLKNEWLGNQPCDIFGIWQTEEYDPPTAENGVVPRNEYGNVELFTPKMLPKKTVHLQLPGLNRVCKRLGIDCAPVLTGFEMARMRMIPVYDGFVVCEEFANKVVEEWYKEMEEEERREQEKYEKRIYGNWKRLIKGLLVRRKLQNKYNFDNL